MIETVRSVVHPWECDAVEHFTTAYYYRAFGWAGWHLLQRLGHDAAAIAALRPVSCRTRFLQELRAGDAYHITSGIVEAGGGALVLGHRLFNSETGETAATHAERREGPTRSRYDPGLAAELDETKPVGEVDFERLDMWSTTAMTIVKASDLDHTGQFGLDALIHHASDANVQFQNMIAMTSSYMHENRIGFATAEYQIALGPLPRAIGTVVETKSALAHLGRTSLWMAHRAADCATGETVARIAQSGVHLDRRARRPAEIPPHIREAA